MDISGANGIIVLLSDFGVHDDYVGQVKGAIFSVYHEAKIIDLCHDIPSFDIRAASFILNMDYKHFPQGTTFFCVVDPGVGTTRDIIVACYDERYFVAPDNGLINELINNGNSDNLSLYRLKSNAFDGITVSPTFHGRDIFAVLAAEIASGNKNINDRLTKIDNNWILSDKHSKNELAKFTGKIRYIDKYGNIITDIPSTKILYERKIFHVVYKEMKFKIHKNFECTDEKIFAIPGSKDTIEIVSRQGSAADILKAKLYDGVSVEFE